MHLVFSSDSDSNWQGFSLNFTSVYSPLLDEPTTPSCGNNSACNGGKYIATLSGSGAYVSSSGYPSYYDNNLSCTWLVYSESQVKTNNLHVVLAANGDYLMFFDGPSQDFKILKTYRQTDRQTILVYFAWPTKRPGGHQSQLTMGQSLYAYSAVTAAIRKGQTQL